MAIDESTLNETQLQESNAAHGLDANSNYDEVELDETAQEHVEGIASEQIGQQETKEAELEEAAQEEAREKLRREREARAQALTLEIVGDLPYAEVKPPENVLFVCKLNPVTEDEDLDLIFSRFGKIISCEVIRDKRTNDSLQYAFIEFEHQKDCEQAYFKMQGVLIDDHRIHVDFSQSVSRLSDTWRKQTNSKRASQGGGFGGVSNLEKKRQYRAAESNEEGRRRRSNGYDMVFDKDEMRRGRNRTPEQDQRPHYRSRSRGLRRKDVQRRSPSPRRDERRRRDYGRDNRKEEYRERDKKRW